jgi:hypothetical protein
VGVEALKGHHHHHHVEAEQAESFKSPTRYHSEIYQIIF